MGIQFNYNSQINSDILNNFNKVFKLIRPLVYKEGDKLRVLHRGQEYVIPITRYKKVSTIDIK